MVGNLIKVVGFDPSFANFGIAHATLNADTSEIVRVDKLTLIETEALTGKVVRRNSDDLRRARDLHAGMMEACKDAAIVLCEVPCGTQSARAAWALGIAVGVLAACTIPLIEVTPKETKLASVGNDNATKAEMIHWAVDKYPYAKWLTVSRAGKRVLTNKNEHLADAIAVIHAGVQTHQFKTAVALFKSFRA